MEITFQDYGADIGDILPTKDLIVSLRPGIDEHDIHRRLLRHVTRDIAEDPARHGAHALVTYNEQINVIFLHRFHQHGRGLAA